MASSKSYSHEEYVYTSLFESRKQRLVIPIETGGDGKDSEDASGSIEESEEDLAELVVTMDPLTTGFLDDLKLIVNLAIDKSCYKVKIGVQTACDFAATAMTQISLHDLFSSSGAGHSSVYSDISHSITRVLYNGVQKIREGVRWPLSLMKQNVDTRTVADLIKDAGYEHSRYECETGDGYIV